MRKQTEAAAHDSSYKKAIVDKNSQNSQNNIYTGVFFGKITLESSPLF